MFSSWESREAYSRIIPNPPSSISVTPLPHHRSHTPSPHPSLLLLMSLSSLPHPPPSTFPTPSPSLLSRPQKDLYPFIQPISRKDRLHYLPSPNPFPKPKNQRPKKKKKKKKGSTNTLGNAKRYIIREQIERIFAR